MNFDELNYLKSSDQEIAVCRESDSALSAITLMKERKCHILPVATNGVVTGTVDDRDILSYAFEKGSFTTLQTVKVKDVMRCDVPVITSTSQIRDVIEGMLAGQYEALPVVQHGTLTGIVTLRDVLAFVAQSKSEHYAEMVGPFFLANPFAQRILSLLSDIGI